MTQVNAFRFLLRRIVCLLTVSYCVCLDSSSNLMARCSTIFTCALTVCS